MSAARRPRLPDWLAQRARTHPAHPAVEAGGRSLSYHELNQRAASVAEGLRRGGVTAGEPVALLAANGLEFAVFAHGVPRSGGALMPLNARLTVEELTWQLRDSGARRLLVDGVHIEAGKAAASHAGVVCIGLDDPRWTDEAVAGEEPTHTAGDVHSVIYTSGTSGRPKGALLTYGNFEASAAASAYNLGLRDDDRWLACLPLFHVGGLSILLRSAIYGTTAVIHERFDERAVNEALRAGGVTLLSVVPTMLGRMLEDDGEPYPSSVRAVLVGGGPVAPALLERALGRGLPVLQTYGLTEAASQVTTLSAADALRKLGSAGQPLLGTVVRIEADGRVAAPGEVGEILVSGPTVCTGYLGRAEDTARAIRGGWLHTGDLGALDGEGYLTLADRREDLIVTGGENVYPAEVEGMLLGVDGVAECAVVGLPDAEWGQQVVAVVVPAVGFDLSVERVGEAASRALAGYKRPRRVVMRTEPLPRTASGKLLRRLVREALAVERS